MGIERKFGHLIARFALAGVVLTAGGQKVSAQEIFKENIDKHLQIAADCRRHPLVSRNGLMTISTRPFWHIDQRLKFRISHLSLRGF